MAKKDFRQDTEDIFGLDQPMREVKQKENAPPAEPKEAKVERRPNKRMNTPIKNSPAIPQRKEKLPENKDDETIAPKASVDNLTLKSYYITPRLYKAMKLRAAMSDSPEDKDLSAIVRAALTAYLEEELARL